MSNFRQFSQEYSKESSGESSLRNGLGFPNLRSASERSLLPSRTPDKFETPLKNYEFQVSSRTDIRPQKPNNYYPSGPHQDSFSPIPLSKSHFLQNESSSYINSPLQAYNEGLKKQQRKDDTESNPLAITKRISQDEMLKAYKSETYPTKLPSRNSFGGEYYDKNAYGMNSESLQNSNPFKLAAERSISINPNFIPHTGGSSFQALMEKIGKKNSGNSALANYEPARGSEKSHGVIKGFGVCTNQGIVRNYNEDRVTIVLNMLRPPNKSNVDYWPQCNFFAVYDGHGGSKCAEYLRNTFHHHVLKSSHFPLKPLEALKEAVEIADKEFIEGAQRDSGYTSPYDHSGSCALIALFVDDMLYIANVGDSRAIASQNQGQKRYALTRDHKPSDPQEKARITQAGGQVYQNFPIGMNGKRLDLDPIANPFKLEIPFRVLPGRLSVSRTIGDLEAKLKQYGGNPDVVISKPEITTLKITSEHDFIVLGSDGIYDKVSNENLIQYVWDAKRSSSDKNIHEISKLGAENIVRESMLQKSTDNVTAVVISFGGFEAIEQQNFFSQQKASFEPSYDIKSPIINGKEPNELIDKVSPPKSRRKIFELDEYGLNREKRPEESAPFQNLRTFRASEALQTGGRNYGQMSLLPDIKASSNGNIFAQNNLNTGIRTSARLGF